MNAIRTVWVVAGALMAVTAAAPGQGGPGRGAGAECSIQQDQIGGVYTAELWPDGIVPYTFNANVTEEHRQLVLAAMADLEAACGCDFVARTNQPDYVRYQNSDSNNSHVGRKGGLQVVNIANWTHDTLLHETMHALGCWHEQQRADRDQYMEVLWDNIIPENKGNFDIHDEGTTFGWYDFHSTMHYDRFAWSTSGRATLAARAEYVQFERWLGRKSGLTSGDRWVLTAMYGGDRPPAAFTPVSPVEGAAVGAGWSPAFAWDASDLADTYRLRVADNPGFVSPVIDVVTGQNEYQGGTLADGEVYYWTVEANNAFGATRVWPLDAQVFYTGGAPGPVIYVDAASPGGDGTTWETAFTDLADALGAGASAGGAPVEVRIAQGTYTPDRGTGDRLATFELRAGMTVRGGYGGVQNPDDPDQTGFTTVFDGDLAGDDGPSFENYADNALQVVMATWQFENPIAVEDVEIRGGNADGTPGYGYRRRAAGGGLLAERSDISLSGCTFRDNSALTAGGGIAVFDTDILITGCRVEGNRQTSTSFSASGGGMNAVWGMRPVIVEDTEFIGNTAIQGAGLLVQYVAARLDGCAVTGNRASMFGGGFAAYDTAEVDVRSCVFMDNEAASDDPGGGEGGGMNFYSGVKALVSNTLMAGNTAAAAGGGIWSGFDSDVKVVNTTMSLNGAPVGGAVVTSDGYGGHSVTSVANSILYDDEGGSEVASVEGATSSAVYSDIEGGVDGFGNIDVDPEFGGQFAPASGSPVNDAGLNGVLDPGITEDIYGAARVSDDANAPGGMVIDMGAVEYGLSCPPDLNGDGVLDLFDFLMFVNLFNGQDERADCVDDGGFDLFDFLCFVNDFNGGC